MSPKPAVALLGGTFNPPHRGHLFLAAAARRMGVETVLLVPGGDPPHKTPAVSAEDRLAMTRLAARGEAGVGVWDWEVRQAGVSYTVQTLRALTARCPGRRPVLLAGADVLDSLACWKGAQEIFALADILAFPRAERDGAAAAAYLTHRGARVQLCPASPPPISSTQVRRRIAAGLPIGELVPPAVHEYIRRRGLYRPGGEPFDKEESS